MTFVSRKLTCIKIRQGAEAVVLVGAASNNRQLSAQVEELQDALHKQEAFTELVIAELRRLSVLAGEPVQLPAFPPPSLQV